MPSISYCYTQVNRPCTRAIRCNLSSKTYNLFFAHKGTNMGIGRIMDTLCLLYSFVQEMKFCPVFMNILPTPNTFALISKKGSRFFSTNSASRPQQPAPSTLFLFSHRSNPQCHLHYIILFNPSISRNVSVLVRQLDR